MTAHYCPSCRQSWQEHECLASLCAELKASRQEAVELRQQVVELRTLVDDLTSAIEAAPGVVDLQDVLDSASQPEPGATERLESDLTAIMDAWADKHL
jgi:hypothetical protein